MTFSFNWHGPATDYPADSIEHSGAGDNELRDRVANALKRAADEVLMELGGHDVTVSGYGSVGEDPAGAVASLHVSIPQDTPVDPSSLTTTSAASPPSQPASAPEGSPEAVTPGTEAGGGPGEPLPSTPGGGGPDPAQPEGETGDVSPPDAATSPDESSQG